MKFMFRLLMLIRIVFTTLWALIKRFIKKWCLPIGLIFCIYQLFQPSLEPFLSFHKYYHELPTDQKIQIINILVVIVGFFITYITIAMSSRSNKLLDVKIEMIKGLYSHIKNIQESISDTYLLCIEIKETLCILNTSDDKKHKNWRFRYQKERLHEYSAKQSEYATISKNYRSFKELNNGIHLMYGTHKINNRVAAMFDEVVMESYKFHAYYDENDIDGYVNHLISMDLDHLDAVIYYCEYYQVYISFAFSFINSVYLGALLRPTFFILKLAIKFPKFFYMYPDYLSGEEELDLDELQKMNEMFA